MRLDEAIEAFVAERYRLGYSRPRQLLRPLRLLHETMAARLGAREGREGREGRVPLAVDITSEDLTAVLDVYLARGLSDRSLQLGGTYLRVFCRWLVRKELLLLDPARDLLLPKPARRIGYVPTKAEVERLLRAASVKSALLRRGFEGDEPPAALRRKREKALWRWLRSLAVAEALRDMALLEVLYGSGLRYREACRLDIADLDLRERTLFVKSGKGRKDRVVPLTVTAAHALARYLAEGRPVLLGGETPALYLMEEGGRLSGFWRDGPLKRLVKAAALPRTLTPHRLRHACAVHLLESGADIVTIARLLGHERLDVTALYLSLSVAALDRTLLSSHPREKREHRRPDASDGDSRQGR